MPKHIVTCKTPEGVEPAKKFVESQGGTVTHTYSPLPGFPSFDVDFPNDTITTLTKNEHIKDVELDSAVKTQ